MGSFGKTKACRTSRVVGCIAFFVILTLAKVSMQ